MATDQHRLYIGTQGWDHPNWQNNFYPDDLPGEWQLTYYSNEIPVVYVPTESDWQANVSAMLEDTHDKFRFIVGLQASAAGIGVEQHAALTALSEKLLGVILQVDAVSLTPTELAASLDKLASFHIAVDFGPAIALDAAWLACLERYQINPVCYAENEIPRLSAGDLFVCFLAGDYDPKGLRNIIEPCLKLEQPDRELALIITSASPSLDVLRNANVITNLL